MACFHDVMFDHSPLPFPSPLSFFPLLPLLPKLILHLISLPLLLRIPILSYTIHKWPQQRHHSAARLTRVDGTAALICTAAGRLVHTTYLHICCYHVDVVYKKKRYIEQEISTQKGNRAKWNHKNESLLEYIYHHITARWQIWQWYNMHTGNYFRSLAYHGLLAKSSYASAKRTK